MRTISYSWFVGNTRHSLDLVHVEGTRGQAYSFGHDDESRPMEVDDVFIASVPVTRDLWTHVTGDVAEARDPHRLERPMTDVSWNQITCSGGYLDRINDRPIRAALESERSGGALRLPSEAESEYAARGGPHWRDGFRFSGSDDVEAVAWYHRKHGDHVQPVAKKRPNQLGLYDMSGNVWEWCQDVFTRDVMSIPAGASPFDGPGDERVLRGGCFHNWAAHCTVSKRYQIAPDYHDGCIGFRFVFSTERTR